ncbi:uncharacterized protein [Triticum aestivum]|uniref:uncharacterized protein n=1 Tax=Triticum aestivum TaxID=4565 RepID=UPI001D030996|nr:uncharacterized protein LOC123133960 [Triticum aestivum]
MPEKEANENSDPDVAPIARLQPLNWIRRRQHFNFMQTPEQRCTSPALRNTATGRAVGTGHAHLARQDAAPLPHGGHKCVRLHQIATISISTCPRDIHGRRPREEHMACHWAETGLSPPRHLRPRSKLRLGPPAETGGGGTTW